MKKIDIEERAIFTIVGAVNPQIAGLILSDQAKNGERIMLEGKVMGAAEAKDEIAFREAANCLTQFWINEKKTFEEEFPRVIAYTQGNTVVHFGRAKK